MNTEYLLIELAMNDIRNCTQESDRELGREVIRKRIAELENGIGIQKLRDAYRIAYDATYQSHNGHWDPTQKGGIGCQECINAREARDKCDRILEGGNA